MLISERKMHKTRITNENRPIRFSTFFPKIGILLYRTIITYFFLFCKQILKFCVFNKLCRHFIIKCTKIKSSKIRRASHISREIHQYGDRRDRRSLTA